MTASTQTFIAMDNYVRKTKDLVSQISNGLREISNGKLEQFPSVTRDLLTVRELSDCFNYEGPVMLCRQIESRMSEVIWVDPEQLPKEIEILIDACDAIAAYVDCVSKDLKPPAIQDLPQPIHTPSPIKDGPDRRRHARFLDDVRSVKILLSPVASVTDESFGGIAVVLDQDYHFRPGEVVEIEYRGAPMNAIVRWTRNDGPGRYYIGAEWK